MTWCGDGPNEAYPDRQAGSSIGCFQATPKELLGRYVVPQESGARTNAHYVCISSDSKPGLVICPFNTSIRNNDNNNNHSSSNCNSNSNNNIWLNSWSVLPYSLDTLVTAKHAHDLPQHHQERKESMKKREMKLIKDSNDQEIIYFHLDARMMGLGGYDSWTPNVPWKYLVHPLGSHPDDPPTGQLSFCISPATSESPALKAMLMLNENWN